MVLDTLYHSIVSSAKLFVLTTGQIMFYLHLNPPIITNRCVIYFPTIASPLPQQILIPQKLQIDGLQVEYINSAHLEKTAPLASLLIFSIDFQLKNLLPCYRLLFV